jgi:hypothetical protein
MTAIFKCLKCIYEYEYSTVVQFCLEKANLQAQQRELRTPPQKEGPVGRTVVIYGCADVAM